ncbi:MAG: hypothetical protein QME60_00115 [Verrucomicrobiota bacterium]|nr:hypothetical protein [Verrucomicrobiota bacterium]
MPYYDTFEDHTNNQTIIGANGWLALTNIYAVGTNTGPYTYTNACGLPFPTSNHNVVVKLDTENSSVSNCFSYGATTPTNVWVDNMIQFVMSPDEDARGVITNDNKIQLAYYVNTNGNPVFLHSARWFDTEEWEYRATNVFSTVSDVTIPTGAWARVTVTMDYKSDNVRNHKYFRIAFNGHTVTSDLAYALPLNADPPSATGTYFVCANFQTATGLKLNSVNFSGTGHLDDYKVEGDAAPQIAIIAAIWSDGASGDTRGGWITPGLLVYVNSGGGTNFSIGANTYWSYTNLVVNGAPQTPTNLLAFNNVTSNQFFAAYFAADRTTNRIPHWWLAEQNSGWTNDFNAAASGDPDGDGLLTWEEYLASTDPNDSNSVFRIIEFTTQDNGTNYTIRWPTASIDPVFGGIPFLVLRTDNLTNESWPVAGTVPRAVGISQFSDAPPPASNPVFYRVAVTNTTQ